MTKRPPLFTGTVKCKHFDFTLDDDDFEEHTRDMYPMSDAIFPLRRNSRSEHCCFYGICTCSITFVFAASVPDLSLHFMCCTVCLLCVCTWNNLWVLGDLWKVLFA